KIKVPISRQQVPSGNSVSPEKLTRLLVNCDHTAGAGSGTGLSSGPVSSNINEPAFFSFGSKIKCFSASPISENVTRQRPVSFGAAVVGAVCCAATTDTSKKAMITVNCIRIVYSVPSVADL